MTASDHQQSLVGLFDRLRDQGRRPALMAVGEEARTWHYSQLVDEAARLAAGLARRGVSAKEPVAIFAPNAPEWVVANLALLALGAIPVPLDIRQGRENLAHCLSDSGCRRAFTTSDYAPALREAYGDGKALEIILLDVEKNPKEAAGGAVWWREVMSDTAHEPARFDAGDVAVLFYTSGTTGAPKGVPLTHRNIKVNIDGLLAENLVDANQRVLLPLPLHHVYPYVVGMLVPLAIGASLVFPSGISGPEIAGALREGRVTTVVGVPRLYEALVDAIERQIAGHGRTAARIFRQLLGVCIWTRRRVGWRAGRIVFAPIHRRMAPELELLVSGGARLDPELGWKLQGLGWEVLSGYGLTETAPIIAFNTPGRKKLESVGQTLAGVEVRIDPVEGKEGGEILVRGDNVFSHYHNKPDKTREVFTKDGWLRTGDLGRLDEDGFLLVAARVKETIVLPGGENVFPEEVEEAFIASPFIRDAAVMEREGRLVLLAVPEPAAAGGGGEGEESQEEVRKEVRRISWRLPSFQRVTDAVITRESLPRTTLGKLRRHELPEIYERAKAGVRPEAREEELSREDRALLDDPRAGHVWGWLKERFAGRTVSLDANLYLDVGLDSMDWVTLSLEVEEQVGVRFDERQIAKIETVRGLLEAVRRAPAAEEGGAPEELSSDQKRWIAPKGRGLTAAAYVMIALNKLLHRGVFRLRVEGLERLPADGPFVLTPNHASLLDPFALAAALPRARLRNVYWAGLKDMLFKSAPRRLFSRMFNVFPVDPFAGPVSSLSYGKAVLERGDALVWFPEGERTYSGKMQRFQPGIGQLAEATGAPLVPVHIEGTYAAWPRQKRLPRPRPVRIVIGEPVSVDQLDAEGEGETSRERIAGALREAVRALAGKEADARS